MFTEKAIYQLYELVFHIPSYQRGYRWDNDQVSDLLDDLRDFVDSDHSTARTYWLQPVVVKPLNEQDHYELIDGQQRLTTLYLLLHYLFNNQPKESYSFVIEKRKDQEDFLNCKKFSDLHETSYKDNIDTFYMRKAYDCIRKWFEERNNENEFEYESKFKALLTKGTKDRDTIKVIWYELDSDEIDAFERLNHGRIRLTGTELVKSLLLSVKNTEREQVTDHEAMTRAHSWDRMEKALQQPYFWAMLPVDDNGMLSHIDAVLNVVADEINFEMKYGRNRKKDGHLFNYYVIERYLHDCDGQTTKAVWARIEDTFNKMSNWYDNIEWYNYIALGSRLNAARFTIAELRKMEKDAKNKTALTSSLRSAIGHLLCKDLRDEQEKKDNVHPLKAEKLNYIDTPDELRKFLLAVNVITVVREKLGRFPFHLYDRQNITSLEHIHPQNIADVTSEMSPLEIKEWVNNRLNDLRCIIGQESYETDKITDNDRALLEDFFKEDNKWMSQKHIDDNSDAWQKILPVINKIDRQFGDLAEIDDQELHSIRNMALVTQEANSSLSNHYLSTKRSILINRVSEKEEYLMPLTDRAFSKYYTVAAKEQTGDMRLWRKEDRNRYFDALCNIYNDLTGYGK